MDYKKMGERVRRQRILSDLTQGELAERVGVTGSFIGHIERGEKKASVETVVALCNAMGISPSVLLQDSLTDEVMQSQLSYDEDNRNLVDGLMRVLREYNEKQGYQ